MKQFFYLLPLFASTLLYVGCSSDGPIANLKDNEVVENNNFYEISIDEARRDLLNLLMEIDGSSSRLFQGKGIRTISNSFELFVKPSDSRHSDSDMASRIYIFNFENNEGFAIMSADKRLPSLLAIAESGSLNPNDTIDNPGLGMFFDDLPKLTFIKAVNENLDGPGGSSTWDNRTEYGDWQTTIYNGNSKCLVKWGQGNPIANSQSYNRFTPLEDGKSTITGCSATALAQLMSIYNHPSSYTYNGTTYTFDWAEMTKSPYIFGCSSVAQDMIAQTMVLLGKPENLNISYGLNASGANPDNIQRTLQSFGYSNVGTYTAYSWDVIDQICEELKNGYPAMIGGYSFKTCNSVIGIHVSNSYSGGHIWLVDGLMVRKRTVTSYKSGNIENQYTETEKYFRCNWGWDGGADGYYISHSFTANQGPVFKDDGSRGTSGEQNHYQFKISAYYGIRK